MVPKEKFGRDHWSTFAYLGSVETNREGVPDRDKMRTHRKNRLRMSQVQALMTVAGVGWTGTRLADGTELEEHDDWDCLDDLEAAGLLKNIGTGFHPVVELTDEGWRLYKAVSKFRRAGVPGRSFADFQPFAAAEDAR
jgi:predicted transcriptional regulator